MNRNALDELIEAAVGVNANYRVDSNNRDLEVGFLYGTAELITVLVLGPNQSYSDVREEIAREIDRKAAKDSYPLLPANGGKG